MIEWAARETEAAAEKWLLDRIPHAGGGWGGDAVFAGVTDDTRILAVIAFHDWQPLARTIQLSMAADSPRWATRGTLREIFRYAFETVGANKLWTAAPEDNKRAIRFNRGIGMKKEAMLRHQFGPGRHAIICSMLAAEYARSRWSESDG